VISAAIGCVGAFSRWRILKVRPLFTTGVSLNFSAKWYRSRVIGPFYYGKSDVIAISAARGRRGVFEMADSEC
jgi:hypothetical protein